MKWVSTIPSGGGGSSAIWHLHWLGLTPASRRSLQPTLHEQEFALLPLPRGDPDRGRRQRRCYTHPSHQLGRGRFAPVTKSGNHGIAIPRAWFARPASPQCCTAPGSDPSASAPDHRREVSSVTISAADCDFLARATLCPAHIDSASMSPVVPAIGGAGS